MDRSNSIIHSPVVVVGGACGFGFGFGGIVVGTSFGTPVAVALKAPRNPPGRGSVLVVVFNFGLDENILPVKIENLEFEVATFYGRTNGPLRDPRSFKNGL